MAATTLAGQLHAKIILAETLTGSTALSVSSLRPNAPIAIASPDLKVCNQMAIVWGGKPFLVTGKKNISEKVIKILKNRGTVRRGDWIVAAYGKNRDVAGGTDTIRLLEVD
jgi:pyruvate kinase